MTSQQLPDFYYRVYDGQHTSELFTSLDDARSYAAHCEADEGYSGGYVIGIYDSGSAGHGEIIAHGGDIEHTLRRNGFAWGRPVHDADVEALWRDASNAELEAGLTDMERAELDA